MLMVPCIYVGSCFDRDLLLFTQRMNTFPVGGVKKYICYDISVSFKSFFAFCNHCAKVIFDIWNHCAKNIFWKFGTIVQKSFFGNLDSFCKNHVLSFWNQCAPFSSSAIY